MNGPGFGLLDVIWTALAGAAGWIFERFGPTVLSQMVPWLERYWPRGGGRILSWWPMAFLLAPIAIGISLFFFSFIAGLLPKRKATRGFSAAELAEIEEQVAIQRRLAGLPQANRLQISVHTTRYSTPNRRPLTVDNDRHDERFHGGGGTLLCI